MRLVNFLIYVGVFAACYILFALASGHTALSRFDVASMVAGCLGGELGILYMRHRMKRRAA
jgi:hypothetical protein